MRNRFGRNIYGLNGYIPGIIRFRSGLLSPMMDSKPIDRPPCLDVTFGLFGYLEGG